MKKRVLFVHHISSIGGASFCMLNILKELDRCNIEPIVLLKNQGPLVEEIKKLGVEVVFFPQLTTIPYNYSFLKTSCWQRYIDVTCSQKYFNSILLKLKPEAVYLNNMMLYPYLKTCKKNGIKTIIHVREHWPLDRHVVQLGWAQKYVRKYADHLIAINQYSASMFAKSGVDTTIIYDWINLESRYKEVSFNDIFKEDTSRLKVYLFTGGVSSIKGTLSVLKLFHETIKDSNSRLLILGYNGIDKTNLDIRDRILLFLSRLGYKTYADKALDIIKQDKRIIGIPSTYYITDIYKQAFCMLSSFGIPHANLALAECISLETVCIAANTSESLEYSLNGELAFLFNINDQSDFERAYHRMVEKHDLMKKKLKNKSHIIRELFDRKRNAQHLNNTIIKVLDR